MIWLFAAFIAGMIFGALALPIILIAFAAYRFKDWGKD